jgi:hypothetical protein
MPYSTRYPAENSSFGSIALWIQHQKAKKITESENTIVGRTNVRRYQKLREITLEGFCGTSEASSLHSAEGTTATLTWPQGSDSAYLERVETSLLPEFSLAEFVITVVI